MMEDEKLEKKRTADARRKALESKKAQTHEEQEQSMKSDARLRAQYWADNIIKDLGNKSRNTVHWKHT
jgi:hypothetical protein